MVTNKGNNTVQPPASDGLATMPPGDCLITPAMRRQLHDRRLEAGLTFVKVGELLGVHGTTVQKWERGKTQRCNIAVWTRLQQLLDRGLAPAGALASAGCPDLREIDGRVYADGGMDVVLRRAQRLHALCVKEGKPELGGELIRRLTAAVDAVLHKLAG